MNTSTFQFLKNFTRKSALAFAVSALFSCLLLTTQAHAAMVSTESVQQTQVSSVTRAELLASLSSKELQASLESYGVDPKAAQERVANLTDAEIADLNATLSEQAAGAGVVGALVTIFIVLVVTDMLCATDVFNFVHCINK